MKRNRSGIAMAHGLGWFLVFLAFAWPIAARGDGPFPLKGGERVVFFGDSITQAGTYITYLDAYLLTRFPDQRITLINHGISSETVSGASETDHPGRRPNAHDRFTRDVKEWSPDVVVACFGMNDGIYRPFDEDLFARYQAGVRKLVTRTHNEARARLVLLTPPPFDPYRRKASDPEARAYGYRFPAVDYDQTLGRYSDWLLTLQSEGILVADVHKATNEHLKNRRDGQVSFYLAGDAVHPGPTGHWLMAQTLLLAWHAPADVAEATIDAAAAKAVSGDVRDVARKSGDLVATWRTPLPMPIDPDWDARSIAQERVSERLNRYRLTVTGLPDERYHLWARTAGDDAETDVATLTREQLAKGVDLTTLAAFPTVKASQGVLARLKAHRQGVDARWRKDFAQPDPANAGTPEDIRTLCQPKDVSLRLAAE